MKYNYVILGSCEDYYKIAYSQLDGYSDVKSIMDYIDSDSIFLKTLFKFHNSIKLNNIIRMPFRNIWYPYVFKEDFKEDKPLCILIFARNALFSEGYIKYLRYKYENCRIVVFWQDLVKTDVRKNIIKQIEKVDLAYTFDPYDAMKYGMIYHPSVYSPYDCGQDKTIPQCDVYFLGKAKDRYELIIKTYEDLREKGLKCDFYITGVDIKDRKHDTEIHYCEGMSYVENLKHVKNSKCLLEIMQGGASGYTFRVSEAMMYNKRIITNNRAIVNADFFNHRNIQQFTDPSTIDASFVLNTEPVVYPQKDNLLPIKLIEHIDKTL